MIADSRGWFVVDGRLVNHALIHCVSRPDELNLEAIAELEPDIIFFIHWSYIVPSSIHKNYESVVFHTAPLPYGRGGSPIQNLILAGYESAPVCAIRMTEDIDAGPIYSQVEISLRGNLKAIFSRISVAVNSLIIQILTEGPKPVAQKGHVHVFSRLGEEDNRINGRMTLKEIYDRIRMVDSPEYAPAFMEVDDLTIELREAKFDGRNLVAQCTLKN